MLYKSTEHFLHIKAVITQQKLTKLPKFLSLGIKNHFTLILQVSSTFLLHRRKQKEEQDRHFLTYDIQQEAPPTKQEGRLNAGKCLLSSCHSRAQHDQLLCGGGTDTVSSCTRELCGDRADLSQVESSIKSSYNTE